MFKYQDERTTAPVGNRQGQLRRFKQSWHLYYNMGPAQEGKAGSACWSLDETITTWCM